MITMQVILMLLGGIGLFIFALNLMEDAVRVLAGRSFKLFVRSLTHHKLIAVLGSALLAALLQGSSVLLVMVLTMVGAGVLPMSGALAFILGANLGTTLDSWMVAVLGFKLKIESFAYPAIILAALFQVLPSKEKLKYYARLLYGFGLLFISVSIMKLSIEDQLKYFDFSRLEGVPSFVFVITGLVMTVLIQSSLATMTLALTALHGGAIDFQTAAAVVIGSEVGTTVKIFFGALDGLASKKQMAVGNFMINVFTAIVAYAFLNQITGLVQGVFGIRDPLVGLVAFQSIINLFTVIAFLPFLNVFARFLEKKYPEDFADVTSFISEGDLVDPSSAVDLLSREANYFLHLCMIFNLEIFGHRTMSLGFNPKWIKLDEKRGWFSKTHAEQYEYLKNLQGELQLFYLRLRNSAMAADQVQRLELIISAVRSAMHAAKSTNDVNSNIHNLYNSSNDIKYAIYSVVRKQVLEFYLRLEDITRKEEGVSYTEMKVIYDQVSNAYAQVLDQLYDKASMEFLRRDDFTTLMNFNREIFTSNKAMLYAVKDLSLKAADAARFNELPVYKT